MVPVLCVGDFHAVRAAISARGVITSFLLRDNGSYAGTQSPAPLVFFISPPCQVYGDFLSEHL